MRFGREGQSPARSGHQSKFTGEVWQSEILERTHPGGLRGLRLAYAPRGRSNWHIHEGEQAIVVVAGRGLVKREGDSKAQVVGPGDWVHIEPGEVHWHGAAPDNVLVHLAITASGGTDWRAAVDDDEYDSSLPA